MNRIAVFNLREFDEAEWFERYGKELGLEISGCADAPDVTNIARVTEGCECADIITSQITRELMEEMEQTKGLVRQTWEKKRETGRNYLFDHADEELSRWAEQMRLGKDAGNAKKSRDQEG